MNKIEFNFTGDEFGMQRARRVLMADNMASLLFEIKHNMWRTWKHDEKGLSVDSLRENIADLFEGYGVCIDNLID